MTPREYAERAAETAIYDPEKWHDYLAPAILGEFGEIVGRFAKHVRDCDGERFGAAKCNTCRPKLIDELGDLLWVTMMYLRHLAPDSIPERWAELESSSVPARLALDRLGIDVVPFRWHWIDGQIRRPVEVLDLLLAIDGLACALTVDLWDLAAMNLEKLAGRAERGTLSGDGER